MKMINETINVEDKLFSTIYGEVIVFRLVENTGKIIQSTKDIIKKEEIEIAIKLPIGIGSVWEDYNMFGYSLEHKSKLKTLFKNKEEAIEYLINLKKVV